MRDLRRLVSKVLWFGHFDSILLQALLQVLHTQSRLLSRTITRSFCILLRLSGYVHDKLLCGDRNHLFAEAFVSALSLLATPPPCLHFVIRALGTSLVHIERYHLNRHLHSPLSVTPLTLSLTLTHSPRRWTHWGRETQSCVYRPNSSSWLLLEPKSLSSILTTTFRSPLVNIHRTLEHYSHLSVYYSWPSLGKPQLKKSLLLVCQIAPCVQAVPQRNDSQGLVYDHCRERLVSLCVDIPMALSLCVVILVKCRSLQSHGSHQLVHSVLSQL